MTNSPIKEPNSYAEVKDSGDRTRYDTGAVRDKRSGKGRYDLIPFLPLERLAQHYENGARKYVIDNWKKGIPLRDYLDSAIRHAMKLLDGQDDEDHASALVWNIFGYEWTKDAIERGKLPIELDNIGHCVVREK